MQIFHYDSETGALLRSGLADPDPLNKNNWLIPAHATIVKPPPPAEGNVRVYRNGQWGYVREETPGDDPETEPQDPLPPTIDDVAEERERRLAMGFFYNFDDERGIHHIGTTAADLRGWDEVTKLAAARLAVGDQTTPIAVVTGTGPTSVTPAEWQLVQLAAAEFRQPLWQASFVLQAMDPIPADYANEDYWP